jgi:hypothetical protein
VRHQTVGVHRFDRRLLRGRGNVLTLIFFLLREALAEYGSVYLVVLRAVAVLVMVKFPRGLWGYLQQRFDLRFFPVQRRVRLGDPVLDPRPVITPN